MDINDQIQQRVEAQKAMGHLNAVTEYFHGAEPEVERKYKEWKKKLKEFEEWLWRESPIA